LLKTVLYYLLLLTTTVRFIDIIYLMTRQTTNLPIVVLIVSTAMVLYGIVLLVKKVVGNVRLKQLTMFYMVQSVMIVFNLSYMAIVSPLKATGLETLIVGTFLDLLINCGIIYMATKQMRDGVIVTQR